MNTHRCLSLILTLTLLLASSAGSFRGALGAGAYQAPNRAHNLRTTFTPEGIHVIPRVFGEGESSPTWRWSLALAGYGAEGDVRLVEEATLSPLIARQRSRVVVERPGLLRRVRLDQQVASRHEPSPARLPGEDVGREYFPHLAEGDGLALLGQSRELSLRCVRARNLG